MMNKLLMLISALLLFASCSKEKEYTCECSFNGNVFSTRTVVEKSKKAADNFCQSNENTANGTYECKILE